MGDAEPREVSHGLEDIHPWGRSLREYRRMFSLGESDLGLRILGCADGPASFNAEATRLGGQVVSCDPLYTFGAREIRARIEATYDPMLEEVRRNESAFLWTEIASVEELGRIRWDAMAAFLEDFSDDRAGGRYVSASLPRLPFSDASFGLALCSHYLFLYSGHLTREFHVQAIAEMCRVAPEARIFPLLSLGGAPSAQLEPVCTELERRGFTASIEPVPYEFQRGGNEMLRVVR